MIILAIPGSLRSNSSNHAVVRALKAMAPADVDFKIYEGIGQLPHFDDSLKAPSNVEDFRKLIAIADSVIICSPEYAFGVPGSLKNAIDWTVGSGELTNKPVALITAATGGENAHAAWSLILKAISAKVEEENKLLISFIRTKIENGEVTDSGTLISLRAILNSLISQAN